MFFPATDTDCCSGRKMFRCAEAGLREGGRQDPKASLPLGGQPNLSVHMYIVKRWNKSFSNSFSFLYFLRCLCIHTIAKRKKSFYILNGFQNSNNETLLTHLEVAVGTPVGGYQEGGI
jgi:hypothetical protein